MKKLTKRIKDELHGKIEWEGGLECAVRHGAVLDYVKGTVLEFPFARFLAALNELDHALYTEHKIQDDE